MKHIIFIVILIGFVSARPQNGEYGKLMRSENYNDETGNFRYGYQIDDTIYQDHKENLTLSEHTTSDDIVQEINYVSADSEYKPQITIVKQDQDSLTTQGIRPILENRDTNASNSVKLEEYITSKQELSPNGIQKEENKDEDYHPQVIEAIQKEDNKNGLLHPLVVVSNSTQNSTASQQMNRTAVEEFPDRIGTVVIITLAGPG